MSIDAAKAELRREMRSLRRALPDRSERSAELWKQLLALPGMEAAETVMVFASIPGEPETAALVDHLERRGARVLLPEDSALDPDEPDLVVVPGLAFTADGRRLGQGGGWYDRFLPQRRSDCPAVGVCFTEQLVDDLPTDRHDVVLDTVLHA